MVSWEPFNTAVLEQVPDSYVVLRGGGYLSYIMVATAHEPTIKDNPRVIRYVVAGLAAASQYTRQNRNEAVEIFSKFVPNTDLAVAKKAVQHISYDPRLSPAVMKAFEAAEDDILKNTLQGAARLEDCGSVLARLPHRDREGVSRIFFRPAAAEAGEQ